jgi:TDG/mug DNA glycosylase family protein
MNAADRRRADLERYRGGTLPDVVDHRTRLLFVGTNPGLSAVAVQAPFSGRSNRFFPALFRAGITEWLIDTSTGWKPHDHQHLIDRRVGITTLVPTATARADELGNEDLVAGAARLAQLVRRVKPTVVAVLGVTAFRIAFGQPRAVAGLQPEVHLDAQLWVVPNPIGLNRRVSLAELAAAYRQAAGVASLPAAPHR